MMISKREFEPVLFLFLAVEMRSPACGYRNLDLPKFSLGCANNIYDARTAGSKVQSRIQNRIIMIRARVKGFPLCDSSGNRCEDSSISSQPNALVLFNPVLLLDDIEGQYVIPEGTLRSLTKEIEVKLTTLSPYHHITDKTAPTIIFHGTADTLVPYRTAELFNQQMNALGNNCTLVGYKGEDHAFFNYGRKNNGPYIDTVHRMDEFLVSIGYLPAPPKVIED